MSAAPLHPQEAERQAAVQQLRLTGEEFEQCFDRLTRLIRDGLGVPTATFTVVDSDRQFFKSVQGLDVRETPRDMAFCAHAILGEEALIVNDASKDPRFSDNPLVTGAPHIRFYAGIPIHAPNGLPVGTLCAIDSEPRELTPQQLLVLEELRNILEETLQSRSPSLKDQLTGLFNRGYFEDFFEREWRRGFASTRPLSLLLVDIDHFRPYGEIHGQQAADGVLQRVAQQLRLQLRPDGDTAARYEDDAFVVVLPDTNAVDAAALASQLCESVQQLAIPHPSSPDGVLTVSVGGASIAGSAGYRPGRGQLLDRAKAALFEAKRGGRNRVLMG